MSLFNDLEVTGSIHLVNDSDVTKKGLYDWDTSDYSLEINIIRMGADEQIFYTEEMATYFANVDHSNAQYLVKGAGIKVGTKKYLVTNEPKLNKLFTGTYSIRLRETNA